MPKQSQPTYEITASDRERQKAIERAWKAFEDELEEPLTPMDGEDPELANVAENVVSSTVEDITSFLFGDKLEIRVEDGAPEDAQKLLDDTWGRNESRMPLLQKLSQNGILSGHAFLRLVPLADGSIRLVVIDPYTVFVQSAKGDCETVLLYCIDYAQEEQSNGKSIQRFYREEIVRIDPQMDDPDTQDVWADQDTTWRISHWTRLGDKGPWSEVGDPYIWPYSYCPIQSCQNLVKANSFWGKPDATKGLIALNKAINFVLSNINKVGKLYAQPILYAPGTGNGFIELAVGKIIQLPLADQSIQSVSIHSDLANQLLFLEKLHGAVERTTSVPAIASGIVQNIPAQISGIALRTMCMALLKKIDKKRNLYGKLIIDVSKAILQLKGFDPNIDITLYWQEPLPSNMLENLQAAILKEQIGFSRDTTLRELGADPEREASLVAKERDSAVTTSTDVNDTPMTGDAMEEDQEHEMVAE